MRSYTGALLSLCLILPGCGTPPADAPPAANGGGIFITEPGEYPLPGPCVHSIKVAPDDKGVLLATFQSIPQDGEKLSSTDQRALEPGWFIFVEADNHRFWTWYGKSLAMENYITAREAITTVEDHLYMLNFAPAEVYNRLREFTKTTAATSTAPDAVETQPVPK